MRYITSLYNCPLICKVHENLMKNESIMLMIRLKIGAVSNQENVTKMHYLIGTVFVFVKDFFHVHLICKL